MVLWLRKHALHNDEMQVCTRINEGSILDLEVSRLAHDPCKRSIDALLKMF